MRNNNSENPNEKIEFILSSLIEFSNNNEFDYALYKSFAKDSSKSFIRYFSQIKDQTIKEKIISDLHTDFYFIVNDAVTNMLASNQNNGSVSEDEIYISKPIPDNRIRSYESNYMKLKETFLNLVLTEIKPQEPGATEMEQDEITPQKHTEIFKDNAFEIWQSMFEKFNIKDKSQRTDIDFMFEIMKYNNLIHEHIGYTDIRNWINRVYEILFDKVKYTNHKTKANEKRLIIYKEIINR